MQHLQTQTAGAGPGLPRGAPRFGRRPAAAAFERLARAHYPRRGIRSGEPARQVDVVGQVPCHLDVTVASTKHEDITGTRHDSTRVCSEP